MVKLKIDNIECEVPEGTTILETSGKLNIEIPTLCHKKGLPHYSSCMVCIVKNKKTGKFIPSCAALAEEEMDIDASGSDVIELRMKAIDLLLSEHRAECEAPCKIVCPAELDIPLMNRLIAKGEMIKAAELAWYDMGFPETMCSICPAFCESACRRGKIDTNLAITGLKSYVTENHGNSKKYGTQLKKHDKRVAVIGGGPFGLSVAFHLAKKGYKCVIFEKRGKAGGRLINEFSEKRLPEHLLIKEIEQISSIGIDIQKDATVDEAMIMKSLLKEFDLIVSSVPDLIMAYKGNTDSYLLHPGDATEINGKYIFTPASVSKNEKSTVRVFGEGKKTAGAIELFLLSGKPASGSKRFNSTLGKISEAEKQEWLKECKVNAARYSEFSADSEASAEAESCMHCDCRAQNDCRLRDLAGEFGLKNPREKLTNGLIVKKINFKTGLVFENAKCIKCGICVRICNDTVEDPPLCFTGRGFTSIISEPLTDEFNNVLKTKTRECVEACPTGALTFIDQ